jgi:hypothetical protein
MRTFQKEVLALEYALKPFEEESPFPSISVKHADDLCVNVPAVGHAIPEDCDQPPEGGSRSPCVCEADDLIADDSVGGGLRIDQQLFRHIEQGVVFDAENDVGFFLREALEIIIFEPVATVADIFARVDDHPYARGQELTPHGWAKLRLHKKTALSDLKLTRGSLTRKQTIRRMF